MYIFSNICCAKRQPVCASSHCPTYLAHIPRYILRIQAPCMRGITLSDKSRAYSLMYFAHAGCLYARGHAVRQMLRILSDIYRAYKQPACAKYVRQYAQSWHECCLYPQNMSDGVISRIQAACMRKIYRTICARYVGQSNLRIQAACMRKI